VASTYFDNREGQYKSVPDCEAHGLSWNPNTQRCEQCAGCGLALLALLIWILSRQ
jgi:hypothetical protein